MKHIFKLKLIVILLSIIVSGCSAMGADELKQPARVIGDSYEVFVDGEWESITIKGVNMGIAKPGYFPGETAITYAEYYQWFEDIKDMHANVVRVYTLHPPDFYNALYDYNQDHPNEPLYVIHGTWPDEDKMHVDLDAYEPVLNEEYDQDTLDIINAIHGKIEIDERRGKAHGKYQSNVSDYVIGWMIGVEWYPPFVVNTNEQHSDIEQFEGSYFYTENASPFEIWLAEKMELVTSYEMEQYQTIRPMSFTNWVTTDTLTHQTDSSDMDDLVEVNPNHIKITSTFEPVGQFAAYHVYPYYPEFLNHEEEYVNYIDHRGEKNNFAGYLHHLKEAHDMPIMISEFGVPSSRGNTHNNPFGWNQGHHTEEEQGQIVVSLYEDIIELGMLGGVIFTWHDEWFKRTWNTMDYDNPDRRPYWSNAQTSEQHFGLMSFDRLKRKLDGDDEWKNHDVFTGQESLEKIYIDHDERYLYIKVDFKPESFEEIIIPIDVVPEQGNLQYEDLEFNDGIEFVVTINSEAGRIVVDDYYDFHKIQYGHLLEMIPAEEELENNSGRFNPIYLTLNREYYLPDRDETLPFERYETGILRLGNGNPEHEDYDSLTDYYLDLDNGTLELRLPWLLIGAKDPSQKEFIGNIADDGIEVSLNIKDIGVGVVLKTSDEVISFPSLNTLKTDALYRYQYESWDMPEYEPRLKKSYYIVRDKFGKIE